AIRSLNPEVPRDLELICAKAMQKRPEDRFRTAADMATDLRRFAEGDAIVTRAPTAWTQLRAFARTHRARLMQAGAFGLALAAGIWFGYVLPRAELAQVSVAVPDDAATVALALDPSTGEYRLAQTLGRGEVATRLPPGHYRFRIDSADGAYAELSRELRLETPTRIAGVRLALPDELSNMIPIAAGPFTGGLGPYTEQWPRQVYDGHAFYISKYEVTNAEFRAYMDATGQPGPRYLTDRYDASLARRPVVRVTWYQARDYAEWAGGRLPTRLEWDRAARGVDGGLYPWGEDNDLQADVCVGKIERRPNADGWYEAYAASTCDVGTSAFDVTADGLTDVMGNALEWTDTPDTRMTDGVITLVEDERLTQGSHWWRKRADATLASLEPFRADVPAQRFHTGFRIAKGANKQGNEHQEK
ncbi:MAG: SUMF1/EgtB/PvdO family nonheme iron enzyme, partial [Pseudomonadota bacterium]